jgi:hypothetical protein
MLLSETAGDAGQVIWLRPPMAETTDAGTAGARETLRRALAVDASRDGHPTTGTSPAGAGRFRPIAMIVIFDVAAPLAAYFVLRSAGLSSVTALLLCGVFPAASVAIGVIQHRRLDVAGVLVLAGILLGTVLGLVSGNPRLLLVEGSVPTAVFGVACLGSLRTRRPLMFRLALEFTGPDTAKGREMTTLWQYEEFRRIFRVITAVWGVGFFLEAALRVVIVYNTSTGTALATSMATPFVWAGALSAWTVAYGARQRKKGEREAADEVPEPAENP